MNILSVDFDIIMSPCIKLYNNLCVGNANPTELWSTIENQLEIDKFLCYDCNTLHDISILMKRSINNGADFVTIDEHDSLVKDLLGKYPNEKFDITNIDFHHDIAYSKESIDTIKNFDKYTCADWVGYLSIKGYLNKYTWVRASNSDIFDPNLANAIGIRHEVLNKRNINEIEANFNRIYFCFSPQWVPYKYRHLYELIADLMEVSE